jgi:hypothetical protein
MHTVNLLDENSSMIVDITKINNNTNTHAHTVNLLNGNNKIITNIINKQQHKHTHARTVNLLDGNSSMIADITNKGAFTIIGQYTTVYVLVAQRLGRRLG